MLVGNVSLSYDGRGGMSQVLLKVTINQDYLSGKFYNAPEKARFESDEAFQERKARLLEKDTPEIYQGQFGKFKKIIGIL